MHSSDTHAVCRGCGRELRGEPFYKGGPAYRLDNGEQAKVNRFGGFVCSRECDFRACLEQERSMPGHGQDQTSLDTYSRQSLSKWDRP